MPLNIRAIMRIFRFRVKENTASSQSYCLPKSMSIAELKHGVVFPVKRNTVMRVNAWMDLMLEFRSLAEIVGNELPETY
jgi:hypothetical protein